MTAVREGVLPAERGWVGCLVLVCGPAAGLPLVRESVRRAQDTILGDPILSDMAWVGASDVLTGPVRAVPGEAPPAGDDADAMTLYRELVRWGYAAGRRFAQELAFGVLLMHADADEANARIKRLASSATLSTLPIVFRSGVVDSAPDTAPSEAIPDGDGRDGLRPTPEPADPRLPTFGAGPGGQAARVDAVTRTILDAVTATAGEIERRPGFKVLVSGIPPAPPEVLSRQPAEAAQTGGRLLRRGRQQLEQRSDEVDPDLADTGGWSRAMSAVLTPLRARRSETAVGAQTAPVRAPRRISLLYLVAAADPVTPPRAVRARRTDVVMGLMRAATRLERRDPEQAWRTWLFWADDTLRLQTEFPPPDRWRKKGLPERWGEYFDLCECAPELTARIERDVSSWKRRGVPEPSAQVVFLANELPLADAGTMERYRMLCDVASVVWILFMQDVDAASGEFQTECSRLFLDHDDVVDEVVATALTGQAPGIQDAAEHPAGRETIPDVTETDL